MAAMSDITIIGLVLAGGQARRLGGKGKAHLILGQETMLSRTTARLRRQCSTVILNLPLAEAIEHQDLSVVHDQLSYLRGPLSGLLAGLDWIKSNVPTADAILTTPVDSPFLPFDFAQRLVQNRRSKDEITVAMSGGQIQPLHAIWPVHLRDELRHHLETNASRKVTSFQQCFPVRHVRWEINGVDPFFNVNTPDDLKYAIETIVAHPEL